MVSATIEKCGAAEYDIGSFRVRKFGDGGGRVTHIPTGLFYESLHTDTVMDAICKIQQELEGNDLLYLPRMSLHR